VTECEPEQAAQWTREIRKCRRSAAYFLDTFCLVYDATAASWIPFRLWPAQAETLQTFEDRRLIVVLKARQLGLTWLALGFALWLLLFHPAATVLLFSRRDDESVDLLKNRLRGMYDRLPDWLKVRALLIDNDHELSLSNGSRVLAFPTTAGDSYSATLAIVDEADLVPDLDRLLRAVKPTIDGGGRMILLSRADKSKPRSPFKRIYSAARQGLTDWRPVFLPWHARPDRDHAWYESQRADILYRTGSLDDLHEQYPATDAEAISPRALDKRIAPQWLQQCYVDQTPLTDLPPGSPSIPGLEVYRLPEPGRVYVIGADPAEGNPTSDDSALSVLDKETGEEAAALAGKFQPAVLAAHADTIAHWFNDAAILVERNNHGHAVLLWLRDNSRLHILFGHDAMQGWLSSSKGKALLYDTCADAFREGDTKLHSFAAFTQLSLIEGSTLRAPDGEHDDRADAYSLALSACKMRTGSYRLDPDRRLVLWPPARPEDGEDRRIVDGANSLSNHPILRHTTQEATQEFVKRILDDMDREDARADGVGF
jgi:hypothetical protein